MNKCTESMLGGKVFYGKKINGGKVTKCCL